MLCYGTYCVRSEVNKNVTHVSNSGLVPCDEDKSANIMSAVYIPAAMVPCVTLPCGGLVGLHKIMV